MQNCLRWVRSHSRRRFPVVGTPYAPPSARPCGCRGTVALVRRCALCGWSVACGQSCGVCPRPPLCFAAARHQPCALVCPSAPRGGSLSPRATAFGFATVLVAAPARNTGAAGLTACKPAWPLAYFSQRQNPTEISAVCPWSNVACRNHMPKSPERRAMALL